MDDVTKNGHFWEWLKNREKPARDETFKPAHVYIDAPRPLSPNEDRGNERGVVDVNTTVFQL